MGNTCKFLCHQNFLFPIYNLYSTNLVDTWLHLLFHCLNPHLNNLRTNCDNKTIHAFVKLMPVAATPLPTPTTTNNSH